MAGLKSKRHFFSVPFLLLIAACTKTSPCLDLAATNYGGNDSCQYSKAVWYILNSDSLVIKYPDMFPLTLKVQGVTLSNTMLDSAAFVPGQLCDNSLLPKAYYLIDSLTDSKPHSWTATASKYGIVFNGVIQATADSACISVRLY